MTAARPLLPLVKTAALLIALLLSTLSAEADENGTLRHSPYLAGQFLIATERMGDPRFREAVLYMVDHDGDGAFGLIINRPLGTQPLADFMAEVGVEPDDAEGDIRLYFGGPVEPAKGFVLHSPDYNSPETRLLGDGLALSADPAVLRALAQGTGPRESRVILGYAGWGPGQLEGEMNRGDWISSPADADLVFDTDDTEIWSRARSRGGVSL